MSEQTELREALAHLIAIENEHAAVYRTDLRLADALLAGPVGKLQAELVQLREEKACQFVIRSDEGTAYCSLAERADPERIRREAIGAWVQANEPPAPMNVHPLASGRSYRAHALAAGESAVTSQPTRKAQS